MSEARHACPLAQQSSSTEGIDLMHDWLKFHPRDGYICHRLCPRYKFNQPLFTYSPISRELYSCAALASPDLPMEHNAQRDGCYYCAGEEFVAVAEVIYNYAKGTK